MNSPVGGNVARSEHARWSEVECRRASVCEAVPAGGVPRVHGVTRVCPDMSRRCVYFSWWEHTRVFSVPNRVRLREPF